MTETPNPGSPDPRTWDQLRQDPTYRPPHELVQDAENLLAQIRDNPRTAPEVYDQASRLTGAAWSDLHGDLPGPTTGFEPNGAPEIENARIRSEVAGTDVAVIFQERFGMELRDYQRHDGAVTDAVTALNRYGLQDTADRLKQVWDNHMGAPAIAGVTRDPAHADVRAQPGRALDDQLFAGP